jgi:hypothetical protein
MPSQGINFLQFVGQVSDPTVVSIADGAVPQFKAGHDTERLVDELHGKFYTANYRGKIFEANGVQLTLPVVASNLASVFTLFNPPGSGVNAEIVDATVTQFLAATVVDQVGWYFSPVTSALAGTFTTLGTTNSGVVGANPANRVLFYSAYTHSGTPKLVDAIAGFGALTNVAPTPVAKLYDGRLILPPGVVMSIAMATAATGSSGVNLEARWCEWPV